MFLKQKRMERKTCMSIGCPKPRAWNCGKQSWANLCEDHLKRHQTSCKKYYQKCKAKKADVARKAQQFDALQKKYEALEFKYAQLQKRLRQNP